MTATVSDILAARAHAGEPSRFLVVTVSVVAHASFLFLLATVARSRPAPFIPTSLPVRVVSPASLGRPAARPAPAAPAAPKPKPVIEKPQEKPLPSEKAMPLPKTSKEKSRPTPKPAHKVEPSAPPAPGPALELPSAGSPSGESNGSSLAFGASVSAFDSDFPFAYYVEQLQSLIGATWLKPSVPDGTSCVLYFRILRSGQVTEVKVEAPSGYPFYDRAASRSIYGANPLPPLPPEFRGEYLGVHIKFQ